MNKLMACPVDIVDTHSTYNIYIIPKYPVFLGWKKERMKEWHMKEWECVNICLYVCVSAYFSTSHPTHQICGGLSGRPRTWSWRRHGNESAAWSCRPSWTCDLHLHADAKRERNKESFSQLFLQTLGVLVLKWKTKFAKQEKKNKV